MSILPDNPNFDLPTSVDIPGAGEINLLSAKSNVPSAIDSLIASIAKYKLAYPYKYEISFYGTDMLSNLRLAVSCESAQIPGKTISTQQIKMHGPIHEIPYEESFAGDLDVTFKVAGDMFERTHFESWQQRVVNPATNNLRYQNQYSETMEITQLDLEDQPIYRCILEDVWPKTIGPLTLSDEGAGNHKIQIGFSYRKWHSKDPEEVGFLQGVINRLDLRGHLNRGLTELFGDNVPMIPTAVGGTVLNLPWGFDPGNITSMGGDMISNHLNDLLG